jgi:hypothetical protein
MRDAQSSGSSVMMTCTLGNKNLHAMDMQVDHNINETTFGTATNGTQNALVRVPLQQRIQRHMNSDKSRGKGHVYAVVLDNGLIKIGMTRRETENRVREFNNTSSHPLVPFLTIETEYPLATEQLLHRMLKQFKIDGDHARELFQCTKNMVLVVKEQTKEIVNTVVLHLDTHNIPATATTYFAFRAMSNQIKDHDPGVLCEQLKGKSLSMIQVRKNGTITGEYFVLIQLHYQTKMSTFVNRVNSSGFTVNGKECFTNETCTRAGGALKKLLNASGDFKNHGKFSGNSALQAHIQCQMYEKSLKVISVFPELGKSKHDMHCLCISHICIEFISSLGF